MIDFRKINKCVECHTWDDVTDICGERLREWRQIDSDIELVDLKYAYLQIHEA